MVNRADARFCLRCGGPLDAAAMMELKGKEAEEQKLMWAAFSPSSDPKQAKAQSDILENMVLELLRGSKRIQSALGQLPAIANAAEGRNARTKRDARTASE